MAVLEGAWNCAQCGKKNIPGLTHNCPLCGDPHNSELDPSEAFYLPTNAKEVTGSDKLRVANSGAKWNCGYCGSANLGNVSECIECGRPYDGDDFVTRETRYVSGIAAHNLELDDASDLENDSVDAILRRADKLQELETVPVAKPIRTLSYDDLPQSGTPQYEVSQTSNAGSFLNGLVDNFHVTRKRLVVLVVALLVILGVFGVGHWIYNEFIATQTVEVTVKNLNWERQVEVEELRTLTQEDWSVPSDGRIITSRTEIREYRQVLDHYETRHRREYYQEQTGTRTVQVACGTTVVDRGNGSYETKTQYCNRSEPVYTTKHRDVPYQEPIYRQEPVYDTKYRYEVDRWVTDHWDKASDTTHGDKPTWPEPVVRGDKQRVGDERHEEYIVSLHDTEGRSFRKEIPENEWSQLKIGQVLTGEQTRRGDLVSVNWT